MLSYERLSKKPLLFKSFTGLTVQEFDNIFDKKITKRYEKYEIQRLSKRKDREREIGAGRHFKLNKRDRILMLLVYYRLYITYTLSGFLFNLDQSNICRDIQKIESLIRECLPIPQKTYPITKRLKTPEAVEKYFPGFLAFTDCTEQQIPRPVDKNRRRNVIIQAKKKRHTIKNQITVTASPRARCGGDRPGAAAFPTPCPPRSIRARVSRSRSVAFSAPWCSMPATTSTCRRPATPGRRGCGSNCMIWSGRDSTRRSPARSPGRPNGSTVCSF